jgi:hypothetical protein
MTVRSVNLTTQEHSKTQNQWTHAQVATCTCKMAPHVQFPQQEIHSAVIIHILTSAPMHK